MNVIPDRAQLSHHPQQSSRFKPLRLKRLSIWPPVVLAPMAGITNAPFRDLCRKQGAGLYVCEMITARLLATRTPGTLRRVRFAPSESPRSVQLYGTDPFSIHEATKLLVGELGADHIDLNFGCPVRKVTRKGGGAAIPLKPMLFANIINAAISAAGECPVTVKFRMGISDQHLTYLNAGKIAEAQGASAVALHARTAAQLYSGEARWNAISQLKSQLNIPVLGNGDIWEAGDAIKMMQQTGCDGVVIGRGCLGRPWIFRQLAQLFDGLTPDPLPDLKTTMAIMLEHIHRLAEWQNEAVAVRSFRKHTGWYLSPYPGTIDLRRRLLKAEDLESFYREIRHPIANEMFAIDQLRKPRGKFGAPQKVSLPQGYLDNPNDATPPCAEAEMDISGG